MRFYQIWHGRNQRSPAQRWFRQVLKEVADRMLPAQSQPRLAGAPGLSLVKVG